MDLTRFGKKAGIAMFVVCIGVGAFVLSNRQLTERAEPYVKYAALLAGLRTAAFNANSQGPRMVDADTKFERAEVGPGATITYHMSLPNHVSTKVDIQTFAESIRKAIQKNVCGNAEMIPSMKDGATYVYVYTSADQVEIVRFEVNKTICGI